MRPFSNKPEWQNCPAFGCSKRIPKTLTLCKDHWAMAPHALRQQVLVTSRWIESPDATDSERTAHATATTALVDAVNALVTPPAQRTPEQQRRLYMGGINR